MKKVKTICLLLILGIIFVIPKGVEAKTYDISTIEGIVGSVGGTFTVNEGDIFDLEFTSASEYSVDNFKIFDNDDLIEEYRKDSSHNNIPSEYIIKTYKELTGKDIPAGKSLTIQVNIRLNSSTIYGISVYYTLVDNNPKEVVYHNTYDVENNNPTSYYVDETDILLSDISRDGYKFLGWYTSPTFEENTRVTMISKDDPDVLELYAKWEKIEEVVDSNEDNIFTNPETNSTSYILIGILSIAILGTVLTIVYRIKKAGE